MNIDFSEEVERATNKYKDEVNTVKQFFNECIIITGDKKDKIPKTALYGRYRAFCSDNELINFVKRNKFYEDVENDYKLEIYRKVDYKGIKEITIDITEEDDDE
jgi:phage/plasmid-associated DNA primase